MRSDLLLRAQSLRAQRTPFVLATVVRAQRPTSAKAGDSALVLPDGTLDGFVGGTCAESTVRLEGLRLLESGESTLLRITPDADEPGRPGEDGMLTVNNPCLSGGSLEIFLEAMIPPALVHVLGDTPVARAMAAVGAALGYEVVTTTDPGHAIPPDTGAVVVASHGRDEERLLVAAARAGVPYIALVASPRRSAAVLGGLDLTGAERATIKAPAGLDIGARSAPEVALSIFAEIIAKRPRTPMPVAEPKQATTPAATDPVCGMSVAVTADALNLRQAGVIWYFCGSGCRAAFADNPDRYLTKS